MISDLYSFLMKEEATTFLGLEMVVVNLVKIYLEDIINKVIQKPVLCIM